MGADPCHPIPSQAIAVMLGLRCLPGAEVCGVARGDGFVLLLGTNVLGCRTGMRRGDLAITGTLTGGCAPCLLEEWLADCLAAVFGFFRVYKACGCLCTVFLLEALF